MDSPFREGFCCDLPPRVVCLFGCLTRSASGIDSLPCREPDFSFCNLRLGLIIARSAIRSCSFAGEPGCSPTFRLTVAGKDSKKRQSHTVSSSWTSRTSSVFISFNRWRYAKSFSTSAGLNVLPIPFTGCSSVTPWTAGATAISVALRYSPPIPRLPSTLRWLHFPANAGVILPDAADSASSS